MTTLRVDKQVCPITLGETATFTLTVDDTDAFPAQDLRVTSVNPRFNENWVHVMAGPGADDGTRKYSVLVRPDKGRTHPFGKYPLQFSALVTNGKKVRSVTGAVLIVKPRVSLPGTPHLDMSPRRVLNITVPIENCSGYDLTVSMKLTHRRSGREENWTFDLDAGADVFALPYQLTELRGHLKWSDTFDLEISAEGVPVLDQPVELMLVWSPTTKLVSTLAGLVVAGGAVGLALVLTNGSASAKVASPQAPTGLHADARVDRVDLSWAAPTSDGGAPLSGYDVYEALDQGGIPSLAGAVPGQATSYSVTDLHPGTRYWFYLTAVNPAGPSQRSNEVSISTETPPPAPAPAPVPTTTITTTAQHLVQIQPPPAPGGLYALAGDGRVNLSWAGPSLDGGHPVSGYRIYEATSASGTASLAGTTPAGKTSYIVTGLHSGTSYWLYMTAFNSVGSSPRSNEVSVTTAAATTTTVEVTTSTAPTPATAPTTTPHDSKHGPTPTTALSRRRPRRPRQPRRRQRRLPRQRAQGRLQPRRRRRPLVRPAKLVALTSTVSPNLSRRPVALGLVRAATRWTCHGRPRGRVAGHG